MNSSNDSLAMQRITRLVDENSFIEIGSLVTARSTDFNLAATDTPSDGVITGHGLIDGNLVFIYSQDASVLKEQSVRCMRRRSLQCMTWR